MIDVGYAVFVNDPEARQNPPVAVFAYEADARNWGAARFAGRHRVVRIRWEEVDDRPEVAPSNLAGTMFNG
jgi:hypothetical protein